MQISATMTKKSTSVAQGQCINMCAMPKPSRNQILKRVLSHLKKDIKEQYQGAKEDKELSEEVKQKQAHRELKGDLMRKGLITKQDVRRGKKKKKK